MLNYFIQFVVLSSLLFILYMIYQAFKSTAFELSVVRGHVWSLLFYKEFLLIVLPAFVLVFSDIDSFVSLSMTKQEDVFEISIVVLLALISFFLCLLILYKSIFFRFDFSFCKNEYDSTSDNISAFSNTFLIIGVSLLCISILFLDFKHAFISSLFFESNLLRARLHNSYSSSLPSQLQFVLTMSWWVSAVYVGFLWYCKKTFKSFLVLLLGFLICSSSGAKAPLVQYVMIISMSYFYFKRPHFNLVKFAVYSVAYLSLVSILVYLVVVIQYPGIDLNDFAKYMIERFGVGQMSGTYETLSLEFYVQDSWWHVIPFASLFVDYPIFSKELMLFTEGASYSDTGVKNSFFIAEAFGMGGWVLLVLSPIIMAFAYILKVVIILHFLRLLFGKLVGKVFTIPIVFLSTSLTGDLSSMAFQKGTILVLLIFIFAFFVHRARFFLFNVGRTA